MIGTEASLTITDYVVLPPTPTSLVLTPTIGGCTAVVTPGTGAPTPALFKIYANTVKHVWDCEVLLRRAPCLRSL